jgi:hypothetical protein
MIEALTALQNESVYAFAARSFLQHAKHHSTAPQSSTSYYYLQSVQRNIRLFTICINASLK